MSISWFLVCFGLWERRLFCWEAGLGDAYEVRKTWVELGVGGGAGGLRNKRVVTVAVVGLVGVAVVGRRSSSSSSMSGLEFATRTRHCLLLLHAELVPRPGLPRPCRLVIPVLAGVEPTRR